MANPDATLITSPWKGMPRERLESGFRTAVFTDSSIRPWFGKLSVSDQIAFGRTICRALDRGVSIQQIIDTAEHGDGNTYKRLTQAASMTLCWRHDADVQRELGDDY